MTTVSTVMNDYDALGTAALKAQVHDRIHAEANLPAPLPAGPRFDDALAAVLVDCSVMGTVDERNEAQGFTSVFRAPAANVAAMEATATAFAKWWATGLGGTGLLAALGIWWKGWPAGVWSAASDSVKVALSLGVALVVVALLAAIATILTADLMARSRAGAAQFDARARIAAAYIATVTRRDSGLVRDALDAVYDLAKVNGKKVLVTQDDTPTFDSDRWRDGDNGYPELHVAGSDQWQPINDRVRISLS